MDGQQTLNVVNANIPYSDEARFWNTATVNGEEEIQVHGLWWLTPPSTIFQLYRGGNSVYQITCHIIID
jgi:hypothetical protein